MNNLCLQYLNYCNNIWNVLAYFCNHVYFMYVMSFCLSCIIKFSEKITVFFFWTEIEFLCSYAELLLIEGQHGICDLNELIHDEAETLKWT